MQTVPPRKVARSTKSGPVWPNAYLFLHIFICQAPAFTIIQGKGEREGEGKGKEKERESDRGGRNTAREEERRQEGKREAWRERRKERMNESGKVAKC